MLSKSIVETVVLSLKEDVDRKSYITRHFSEIGIQNYRFFEAQDVKSTGVKALYDNGKVHTFPDCFRCGKAHCGCANNILIPAQVANWLSFYQIWQSLSQRKGLFLICEDDVSFHKNSIYLLNEFIDNLEPDKSNILIRLANSGEDPEQTLDISQPLIASDKPVMSNAAYIIDGTMAAYLTAQFDLINTTSDVWLHREIANHVAVNEMTILPLPATELSYNKTHAKFVSRIHPKGINFEDEKRAINHAKRVDTVEQYNALYRSWF
jgi:GR25 family glycosyltransferase involved in LPS biosynthesis